MLSEAGGGGGGGDEYDRRAISFRLGVLDWGGGACMYVGRPADPKTQALCCEQAARSFREGRKGLGGLGYIQLQARNIPSHGIHAGFKS